MFFICGVYIGSQFTEIDDSTASFGAESDLEITKGAPGTNNILRRWTAGNMKYLRGAAEELRDVARMAEALVGLAPPAALTHVVKTNFIETAIEPIDQNLETKTEVLKGLSRPMMPNSMYNHVPEHQHILIDAFVPLGHTVSGTQQKNTLKNSLHATARSYMEGPSSLDNENLLVGAWVYLDDSSENDKDMRTIFSNKKSGCENQRDQFGLSMYVNAWETGNHRLYVEFGGLESGCHKLDSNGVQLHPKQWYHVAVYLGGKTASLYIDGTVVSSSHDMITEGHQVQLHRPLQVGQYGDGQFPFYGNLSHLAFIHCDSNWKIEIIEKVVKSMMDVSMIKNIKGIYALYSFSDATTEISSSIAKETINSLNGIYTFPLHGTTHTGINIDLVSGVEDRLITTEMKDESIKLGRIRKESIKDGMKHAWKGYKTYAWGMDEVKPISKQGSDPWGGMGVTLIDSLDTLWLMGMVDEFQEAKEWVATKLTFAHAGSVSVFEVPTKQLHKYNLQMYHNIHSSDFILQV